LKGAERERGREREERDDGERVEEWKHVECVMRGERERTKGV
jgi:hypothetical protein